MPINVGGDGSVVWVVDLQRAREAYSDPAPQPAPAHGKPYYHEGRSETDPAVSFVVTFQLPRDAGERDAFITGSKAALNAIRPNDKEVKFVLPIEDEQKYPGHPKYDQIVIDWKE
jgi:hypothetical protein